MIGTTLLGGIVGGVLAIPLTAALRTLMFRYVWSTESMPTMETKVRQPRDSAFNRAHNPVITRRRALF